MRMAVGLPTHIYRYPARKNSPGVNTLIKRPSCLTDLIGMDAIDEALSAVLNPPLPAGHERRRSLRRRHLSLAWVRNADVRKNSTVEVLTTDLSEHGVGFRADRTIKVGTQCCIEIGCGPSRLIGEVRIVHSKSKGRRGYEIGADFC